ncbi:hypothetical protein ACS5NO_19290 [Larkinella sp. GY13]|uniref:hypothetical protein n=1 Tax=Larkinella sp. GY13 TaxID=3453720 RepID=UPI003EEE54AA
MKKTFTRVACASLSVVFLTGLFGSCSRPDHRPDNCLAVSSLIEGCPNGFTLFAEIVKSTGNATPATGTPLVIAPGDIMSGEDGCYYKGNLIEPFENNSSLRITTAIHWQQYKCADTSR